MLLLNSDCDVVEMAKDGVKAAISWSGTNAVIIILPKLDEYEEEIDGQCVKHVSNLWVIVVWYGFYCCFY